ncbi:MAG TPA: PepSY-associated TM helix domain-containing protein [Thermoanaerobaculia bacterium]|nr:PepSY-associated TM helix domain-containing protein [Thermoanaerobaculia bacterium]
MPFRKIFFWLHLTAGVLAGIVIFILSVTGVLLAYQRQMLARAERDVRSTGTTMLPASQLLPKEGQATNLTLRSDPHAPVTVAMGREKTLFVDRATGTVLGEGAVGLRRTLHKIEDAHRWLMLDGENRDGGRRITGAANLAFFFIVLSGFWIWVPRTRNALRNALWFRGGLRGKARDFNWHNVLGIWSFLPLVLVVFSGVVISYPWASRLVYRAFGSTPPPPQQAPQQGGGAERGPRKATDPRKLDRIVDAAIAGANRNVPRWQSLSLRLPLSSKGPISVNVDEGNGTRPDKRSQLMLDPKSGQVVEHKTYAQQEAGQKARAWLRWLHTGEAGGLFGQTIAMLASLASAVLVYTGIALAIRRFRGWLKRKEFAS